MSSLGVSKITLQMIKTITKDFSKENKVGRGGYGEVYKGVLDGKEIAVKKLFPDPAFDDEAHKAFENEFKNLMEVKHKNIVQLAGYCYEIAHQHVEHNGKLVFSQVIDRVLCFEYMEGGSLVNYISAESCIHDWPTTYKIIKGICEGLHYLHKGRGEKNYIYHLDLKPDNILLDTDMVPKIGDFGLSRLFGTSKTHQTSSTTKGTIGFMPPEFLHNRMMTPKNDVFSLGVILFYLMAGEKGYNDYCELRAGQEFQEKNRPEFIERVQEYWKKKMQATAGYTWDETDQVGVKECTEIAMRCVETNRKERPTTEEIINDLKELDVQIEKMSQKDAKSLVGQKNLDFKKDIAVDPSIELRFLFEPKRDISCCLQLTNKADVFIAFNIKTNKKRYCAQPNKGIMSPCSKCYITITSRALEKAPLCLDMIIVQGTRVTPEFTSEQITGDFLNNVNVMDEIALPVVYI